MYAQLIYWLLTPYIPQVARINLESSFFLNLQYNCVSVFVVTLCSYANERSEPDMMTK
jgi:hydrogenase-4 membrane subunit HyfE